jgi:hypothetical protein
VLAAARSELERALPAGYSRRHAAAAADEYVDTHVFLAAAAAAVHSDKFVAASAADGEPTWLTAFNLLERGQLPDASALTRAAEIRAWVADLTGGDYEARLVACLSRDRLTTRELPLAASAVRIYNLHLRDAIRRQAARRAATTGAEAPTITFLAAAVAAVRRCGFVAASAVDGSPTWATAQESLGTTEPSPPDIQRAREIIDWTASQATGNDHRERLTLCLASETLDPRSMPLAASAVPLYNRHLRDLIRARDGR